MLLIETLKNTIVGFILNWSGLDLTSLLYLFILRFAINKPEIRFNGADSKYLPTSIPHTRCSSGPALVALSWHLG